MLTENLHSSSELFLITGGYYASGTSIDMTKDQAGVLRFNTDMQRFEYYNGDFWLDAVSAGIIGDKTISPSTRLLEVVRWAEQKMAEEQREIALRQSHPLIKDAWEQYQVSVAMATNQGVK
jgi:hypothetical protein